MSSTYKESQMTPNTALDFAEKQFKEAEKWPRARWRVDGSEVGNSHLLMEKKAFDIQKRYGGQVIELIPPKKLYLDVCRSLGREPKKFVK